MKKVKIIDNCFSHTNYSTDFQISNFFEWDRNFNNPKNDLCFVTDNFLTENIGGENLIAWLIEPKSINPKIYNYIKNNHEKFKYVLTYDKEILEINQKFIFYPHGGCWIRPGEENVYEKSKLISMISSTKNFGAQGHIYRYEIRDYFKDKIDSFGRGHNTISYKIEALKDYMFSISVENSKFDYYFSEKLIDCFMTGTIPIYWGCPSIGDFFDINGILVFDTIEELNNIIEKLTPELYQSKLESVKNNFELAKNYILAEDWIYKNVNFFKNTQYLP
jgi:hypothetical protein